MTALVSGDFLGNFLGLVTATGLAVGANNNKISKKNQSGSISNVRKA